jgi:C1A family cysteine protease
VNVRISNVAPSNRDGNDWKMSEYHSAIDLNKVPSDSSFSRLLYNIPVQNQGSIGACVGMSGKVVINSTDDYRSERLSAMWIYKTAKKYDYWEGEDYSGTSIGGACEGLRKEGVCSEYYYPYNMLNENVQPKHSASLDASTRKIHSYYFVDVNDNQFVPFVKILLQKENLWWSFHVHDNFQLNEDGIVDSNSYLQGNPIGGHAVAITGWKTINDKLYWEIQNSWGHKWGDNGICYMEHDLIKQISLSGAYFIETMSEADSNEAERQRELKRSRDEELKRKSKNKKIIIGAVAGVILAGILTFLL